MVLDKVSGKAAFVDSVDLAVSSCDVEGEDDLNYSAVLTDPDLMPLTKRFDILSTYSGSKTFKLADNGLPESSDPYYMIKGKIQLKPLQSAHFAFEDFAKAYEYIDNNRESTMKVLIDVDPEGE